jgi:triacylglycerol esterase/lipase EstA (alpha/beta hydrolase family)
MSETVTTFILDGIFGRPRRFGRLRDVIERSVGPAVIHHYDSTGRTPFETLAGQLADAIRAAGTPVNLVGYSMGGIVIRSAHMLDPTLPIRRVAFLNSPHTGSLVAYLLPFPACRQMRPGSEWMKRLTACDWTIPTLAVWCPGDLVILPNRSACWAKATETICGRVPAHIWPIYSRAIHRRIAAFLAAESCPPVITAAAAAV